MSKAGTLTMSGEYQKEGLNPPLVLTGQQIKDAAAATITNGSIRVSYGKDLQAQAALLASIVEQTFTRTELLLSTPLPLRPHIHLLRLPNERRVIRFSMSSTETNRWQVMPWLMVLTNTASEAEAASVGPEALWADLRDLPLQLFLMVHESCEMHMLDPDELLVMGDVSSEHGWIRFHLNYHTRWFRDGYANYTAYKALQCFRSSFHEKGVKPGSVRLVDVPKDPLSELARVKGRVFDWTQSSTNDYYAAVTALFLLIEQRHGPEAVSAIVRELPRVKFPNRKALLRLVREKTGMDLRQLAAAFEFPDLGFQTQLDPHGRLEIQKVEPNSWAARAELLNQDVLLEINSVPVRTSIELELEVAKAMHQKQTVAVTFSRQGERKVTKALSLP